MSSIVTSIGVVDSKVAFTTLIALIAALLWRWLRKPHPRFPPGPIGLPVLGSIPFLGEFPERTFKKWSLEKYGPVMSVKFGMEDVVVLNSYEAIHQALVKQGSEFSSRPRIKLYTQILGDNGILFAKWNETTKTHKKFAVNALKRFGMGKKQMENVINDEVDYFIESLKPNVGKPQSLGLRLQNLIGNVISKEMFGQRFEPDDLRVKKMFDVLKETYSDPKDSSKIAALLLFFDYTSRIPPFSNVNQRVIDSEIDIRSCIRPLLNEHKQSFDKNHIRDYIDAFIYEQQFGSDSSFTDEQLEVCVRDIFAAGTETTSTTMGWFFLGLLRNPEYQQKIANEILKVFGSTERPSMNKKSELPFTCAFIQEMQRYLPVVPLSLTHITSSDVEYQGYTLPKGTKVIPNLWGAHFDPETWKNPEKFDPYRHIDEEGRFIPSTKVIPFGIGPRFCLGESMARMEIFLILTRILQKFRLCGTGEPLPELLSGLTTIVHTPRKYDIVFKIR